MRFDPTLKQTLSSLLESCSSRKNHLKQIHAVILTTGISVKNSLLTKLMANVIDLGDLHYARQLFDGMHKPRIFLWNTLIKGYVKNDLPVESALIYRQMKVVGVRPDSFTFPFVIKACAELPQLSTGLAVHCHVVKHGLEFISMVRTELIIMYVESGDLGSADYLFDMGDNDLVAWNAFMAACVQTGQPSKALALFRQMGPAKVKPDVITIVSALSACGQLGCLETGVEIYHHAMSKELIDSNVIVENTRLDMFMKCGCVDAARDLFDQMLQRNIISWSTMIVGYAINGKCKEALALFSTMEKEGPRPNYVSYLGALLACSHGGLVAQGKAYFDRMVRSNIEPRKEHYGCMVDLLGRRGHLEEAYRFILEMPIEPDSGVWGALLGACALHKNRGLGQVAADMLMELSSDIASYQVLLSNIYASVGRWDCVDKVRLRVRKKGIKKVVGYSTIEVNSEIHAFFRGDRSHPQSARIHEKLEELYKEMKNLGYVWDIGSSYHDVEMEEKEAAVRAHSEKLAVAFGLLNLGPDSPIRIIKNLRTCDDCHNFCKFVSKITRKEIIMRDKIRFHHFREGICSCKDFW